MQSKSYASKAFGLVVVALTSSLMAIAEYLDFLKKCGNKTPASDTSNRVSIGGYKCNSNISGSSDLVKSAINDNQEVQPFEYTVQIRT